MDTRQQRSFDDISDEARRTLAARGVAHVPPKPELTDKQKFTAAVADLLKKWSDRNDVIVMNREDLAARIAPVIWQAVIGARYLMAVGAVTGEKIEND